MFGQFAKGDMAATGRKPSVGVQSSDSERGKTDGLRCIKCGVIITHEASLFAKDGSSFHTFANSQGIVYRIGCYQDAVSIFAEGEPSTHFSWFAGYGWMPVYCATCGLHMGWQFVGEDSFYGLIQDRLLASTLPM